MGSETTSSGPVLAAFSPYALPSQCDIALSLALSLSPLVLRTYAPERLYVSIVRDSRRYSEVVSGA